MLCNLPEKKRKATINKSGQAFHPIEKTKASKNRLHDTNYTVRINQIETDMISVKRFVETISIVKTIRIVTTTITVVAV